VKRWYDATKIVFTFCAGAGLLWFAQIPLMARTHPDSVDLLATALSAALGIGAIAGALCLLREWWKGGEA
jgi:hypothetical protein